MGRPKKDFDWKMLDAILQYNASKKDCSDLLEVSEDTIERRIKTEYSCTFTEYRDRKMSKTRLKLSQKQVEVALAGNVTMLIFLGKNMLGQSDKVENEINSKIEILIDEDDNKL